MNCLYLDYSYQGIEEVQLAKESLNHKSLKLLDPNLGVSLLTCHRIEYYIDNNEDVERIKKQFQTSKQIFETKKCLTRLARICVGIESKILGEEAIYRQVESAINKYLDVHPENRTYKTILIEARRIKELCGFNSPAHGELIYNKIKQDESENLYLIGAGMLNQTIVNNQASNRKYKKIILVTRDTKKAKRKISQIDNLHIIKPDKLIDYPSESSYDVFVATDKVDEEYTKLIVDLSQKANCKNFVDVSSVPIDGINTSAKNYYSLYTPNTEELVDENNKKIIHLIPIAEEMIKHISIN